MRPALASPGWCILNSAGRARKNRQSEAAFPKSESGVEVYELIKIVSLPVLLLSVAVSVVSCDHDKNASQAKAQSRASITPAETPKPALPPDSGPPPTFDGARALQYVKEIVAFGPRPVGSA